MKMQNVLLYLEREMADRNCSPVRCAVSWVIIEFRQSVYGVPSTSFNYLDMVCVRISYLAESEVAIRLRPREAIHWR